MDKIKSKQVDGVVDKHTDQTVTGSKTFQGVQHFPGTNYTLSISENMLYWVQNLGTLEEVDNMRVFCRDGRFVFEAYNGDEWVEQSSL